MVRAAAPTLRHERELWEAGARVVVGLDEVGRGAWAGPLVVGAAALSVDGTGVAFPVGVRDSKQLRPAERERLFDPIAAACADWAVGSASAAECDELGMSAAQRLAAARALGALAQRPDAVLLDGRWDFVSQVPGSADAPAADGFAGPVRAVVGGDGCCVSVAAASILAKVRRDRWMTEAAACYPTYDFDRNKGYPCPRHCAALAAWGPSAIHRRTWGFMDHLPSRPPDNVGAPTPPGRPRVACATMGQPVTVIERPSSRPGVVRFEINRSLTGMGHEYYSASPPPTSVRPPDELARRLFAHGAIDGMHVNSNVITLDMSKGADTRGIRELIENLFIHYRPGTEVPDVGGATAPAAG